MQTPESDAIVLPDWGDPTSVVTFIVAGFTLVAAALAATGVIIPAGTSATVQAWASVAGFASALVVAIVNQIRITRTHVAAIYNGHVTRVGR
jgi:hypothetical protein